MILGAWSSSWLQQMVGKGALRELSPWQHNRGHNVGVFCYGLNFHVQIQHVKLGQHTISGVVCIEYDQVCSIKKFYAQLQGGTSQLKSLLFTVKFSSP